MQTLPRTRAKALERGERYYFTGRPCPAGHIAPRFTSNHGCSECLRKHSRTYYYRNRDKELQRNRAYIQANPEANRERTRRWKENNPAVAMVTGINGKARARGATGTITLQEWTELLERYGGRCLRCGTTENVGADHVVPIVRGGTNTIDNIQPLCWTCNNLKRTKTIDYRVGGVA